MKPVQLGEDLLLGYLRKTVGLTLALILGALTALSGLSAAYLTLWPINARNTFVRSWYPLERRWEPADHPLAAFLEADLMIFRSLTSISPYLAFALLLASPAALLASVALAWLRRGPFTEGSEAGLQESAGMRLVGLLLLAASVVLSVYLPLIPYLWGEGASEVFGSDAPNYVTAARALRGASPWDIFLYSGYGGYFILLYSIGSLGFDPVWAVRVGPIAILLFHVLGAIAIFYWSQNKLFGAGLGAILFVTSSRTASGLYGGIHGNWFAAVLLAPAVGLVGAFAKRRKVTFLAGAVPLLLLALITHGAVAFTAIASLAVGVAAAGIKLLKARDLSSRRAFLSLALTFAALVSIGLPLVLTPSRLLGMLEVGEVLVHARVRFIGFDVSRIISALEYFTGALPVQVTPMALILSFLGLASLTCHRGAEAVLILSWASAASVTTLLMPGGQMWRGLFLIPSEVLAAFGAASVASFIRKASGSPLGGAGLLASMGLAYVLLESFNYAVFTAMNLGLIG